MSSRRARTEQERAERRALRPRGHGAPRRHRHQAPFNRITLPTGTEPCKHRRSLRIDPRAPLRDAVEAEWACVACGEVTAHRLKKPGAP